MHFEEADCRVALEDLLVMLRFQADAGLAGQLGQACRSAVGNLGWRDDHHRRSGTWGNQEFFTSSKASSWPKPVGEVGDAVCSQVPLGTSFQALPW
ncbi:hypothetical protein D3C84_351350 [compost metagenome]